MGSYAIVKNNEVENVIVINDDQISSFEQIYNAELVNAISYGLCIGDIRINGEWYRNLNGVYTLLEELIPENQTDYYNLRIKLDKNNNLLLEAEKALIEGVESIE